ncbi:MAG TPA: SCO family protein [Pyrinomonadaceae bacterium]|jgi:protein SCO1/2
MNPKRKLHHRSAASRALLFALIALLTTASLSCRQAQKPASGRRYELKGKVVSVDRAGHRITLDHEEIPGYMEAMVMPYALRDEQILAELAPGDQLRATLVVDDTSSRLEDIMFTRAASETSGTGEARTGPRPGDAVKDFQLVNQDNKPVRLGQYHGKALLLTFIYTRCPLPEYCTLMSTNFASIDKELQQSPDLYAKTHLLSVSIDPSYDTPQVLRSYGAAHTGNFTAETFKHWEFATGKPERVKELAQFFGLTYFEEKDQIVHSLRTAVITPDGKIYKVYEGNDWKPAELLRDVKSLLGNSSP